MPHACISSSWYRQGINYAGKTAGVLYFIYLSMRILVIIFDIQIVDCFISIELLAREIPAHLNNSIANILLTLQHML